MDSLGAKDVPELRAVARVDGAAWLQVQETLFQTADESAKESMAASLAVADPMLSVFAFAFGNELAIAHRQRVLANSPSFYSQSLEADVTCLTFMPVMSNRRCDPRPYDWLTICVGLINGRFLVYSVDMKLLLLLSVRFDYGPVKDINVSTDQLVLLYGYSFVSIDHLSLLTALKRRHRLHAANVSETDYATEIVYQKWRASSTWNAIASAGVSRRTLWERAVAISNAGSHVKPDLKKAASFYESYCAVGSKPFVSFLWTKSDVSGAQSLIADTVNRIRNSVTAPYQMVDYVLGITRGGPSPVESPIDRPAVDVTEEKIFFDDRRKGRQLSFAPGNSNLVAVSDSLGRITLWDLRQKLCIHVWKGYRDAQFGWMQVTDKNTDSSKGKSGRTVLLLAIFAPRLSVLQLWLVRKYRKVAIFKVDPYSHLLYSPPLWINKSCMIEPCASVCLLDSTGNIFLPSVPLALCLKEGESSSYWTPELKKLFKERWHNELTSQEQLDMLEETLVSIHRAQDVEIFMDKVFSDAKSLDCRLTSILLESIVARCEAIASREGVLDIIRRRCECMTLVVNFYAVISALDNENSSRMDEEPVSCKLIGPAVIESLNDELSNILSLHDADVECSSLTLPEFLGMFTFDNLELVFHEGISSEQLANAGYFVFSPFFVRLPTDRFCRHYQALIPLSASSWVLMLCSFWLISVRPYSVTTEQFLCLLAGLIEGQDEKEDLLDIVYKSVMTSHRIPEAFCLSEFATAVCTSLFPSDETVAQSWEAVDKRLIRWTAVCKVLRGLYVLQRFAYTCKSVNPSALRYVSEEEISLKNLLLTGSDFLVEMFCKYLSLADPPADLIQAGCGEWWQPTLESLKQLFPFQFSSDSLLLNLAWQTASQWHFCITNVELLSLALQYLRNLSSPRLRHGSSGLIWKTYCCQIAKSLFVSDSEFSDSHVLEEKGKSILLHLHQLIIFCYDSLLEYGSDCSPVSETPCEDFLATFICMNSKANFVKSQTLLERTNQFPLANKRNLELHRQLLLAALTACDIGGYSFGNGDALIALFPRSVRGTFFNDLSTSVSESEHTFVEVYEPRLTYLKTLTADLVELTPSGSVPNVGLLIELCVVWNIDYDILRRQAVVLMLLNGDSETAFQLLNMVEDRKAMADEFFEIICQLVHYRSLDEDVEMSSSMRRDLSSKVRRNSHRRGSTKKLTLDVLKRIITYVDESTPPDWNNRAFLNRIKNDVLNGLVRC